MPGKIKINIRGYQVLNLTKERLRLRIIYTLVIFVCTLVNN